MLAGSDEEATVNRYSCEFTVPVSDMKSPVDWRVVLIPLNKIRGTLAAGVHRERLEGESPAF
jgi:hypothetical protein